MTPEEAVNHPEWPEFYADCQKAWFWICSELNLPQEMAEFIAETVLLSFIRNFGDRDRGKSAIGDPIEDVEV